METLKQTCTMQDEQIVELEKFNEHLSKTHDELADEKYALSSCPKLFFLCTCAVCHAPSNYSGHGARSHCKIRRFLKSRNSLCLISKDNLSKQCDIA